MARSEEIQDEISQLKEAILALQQQLDAQIRVVAAALPGPAKEWMENAIRRKIEEHADTVNAEGAQPLGELKTEFKELLGRLPAICNDALAAEAEWPHRKPADGYSYSSDTKFFDDAFRQSISSMGDLLSKYKLIGVPSKHSADWKGKPGGAYQYAYGTGFDCRQYPAITTYFEAAKKSYELRKKLSALEVDLKKAKASELWDGA